MISSKLLTTILKSSRYFSSSSILSGPRIAVVLSGSGNWDGTDLHEASATLTSISREGATFECYAPDIMQTCIKNHTKHHNSEPDDDSITRNMMQESARIARGNIKPITSLNSKVADAVIFPGGYGCTSNLSDFYLHFGQNMMVDEEIERVIEDFHDNKKPMGFSGLAVIIACKVLTRFSPTVTIGCKDDGSRRWKYGRNIFYFYDWLYAIGSDGLGSVELVETFFCTPVEKLVSEVYVDDKHKIVTTPGQMYDGALHEIYDGVSLLGKTVVNLAK